MYLRSLCSCTLKSFLRTPTAYCAVLLISIRGRFFFTSPGGVRVHMYCIEYIRSTRVLHGSTSTCTSQVHVALSGAYFCFRGGHSSQEYTPWKCTCTHIPPGEGKKRNPLMAIMIGALDILGVRGYDMGVRVHVHLK